MHKLLAFAALLLAASPALAQSKPSDKLPPANPLPYQDDDAAAVLVPIDALFAAIARHDGAAILANTRPEGSGTAVAENADGSRSIHSLSWADFATRIGGMTEQLDERISNPAIEIDGDIAMVWAPYVFRLNGKVLHCGVDHFSLVREAGQWKVLSITWTQRTTGCPA